MSVYSSIDYDREELKKALGALARHEEDVSALTQHNSDLSCQIQHLLKTAMQTSLGGTNRSQVARIGKYTPNRDFEHLHQFYCYHI